MIEPNLKSKRCNAKVKADGMPDFIGGREICTVTYVCTKCRKGCNVVGTKVKTSRFRKPKSCVTVAQEKGSRFMQEDRFFHKRIEGSDFEGYLLAVMDGHGSLGEYGSKCALVAELCAREIDRLFVLDRASEAEKALRRLVAALNKKTASNYPYIGSTLSIACVLENKQSVSIAVLGDSPVIVFDSKGKFHISPEHNVRSNLKERRAVEKRGGMYESGYIFAETDRHFDFGLQMSRALGDSHLHGVLSRRPTIYTIHDPKWILVASDGLIDPTHLKSGDLFEEIKKFAKKGATARTLIKWAAAMGLMDNATAVVWSQY